MQTIEGYYNSGNFYAFNLPENIADNQRVIITLVEESEVTLDEQIISAALKNNPKRVTLQKDEDGNVIIDKDLHPDIYEWAVNG